MVKKGKKGYNLTELQQKMLVYIAENGSTSKKAVSKGMGKSYKYTWNTMKILEERGYIEGKNFNKVGIDSPLLWVTQDGAKHAIIFGVDVEKMRAHADSFYSGEELVGFKAVADLGMFGPAALRAEIAIRSGDISNFEDFEEAATQALKVFPEYLAKHPEIDELFKSSPMLEQVKNTILEMGKAKKTD